MNNIEADRQLAMAIYLSTKKTKRELMAEAAEKRAKLFKQGGKKKKKKK
jgi:hypothetical protein